MWLGHHRKPRHRPFAPGRFLLTGVLIPLCLGAGCGEQRTAGEISASNLNGRPDRSDATAQDPFAIFFEWWREGARVEASGGGPWEKWHSPPDVVVARRAAKLTGGRPDSLEAGDLPVNLPKAPPGAVVPPAAFRGGPPEVYTLSDDTGIVLHLFVPTDGRGPGGSGCYDNRSMLVVAGSTAWTELELNPHCPSWAEEGAAGPGNVDFVLYWLRGRRHPLVELITNGPASIPVYLFRFEQAEQRYRLVHGPGSGSVR